VGLRVLAGDPAEQLASVASRENAELLVLGLPRRAALGPVMVGGLLRSLVRSAPCPIVAVPPQVAAGADPITSCDEQGARQSVVCGVDGTQESRAAATVAACLAARLGLRQVAVHAHERVSRVSWQPIEAPVADDPAEDEEPRAWRVLVRAVAELDGCAEGRFVHDRPAQALERVAAREQGRLIVVGSRGRGTLPSMLVGSVAAQLASASTRPIVIVPRSVRVPCPANGSRTTGGPVPLP
jgi:nucleotide-binding universal stress UspA family protein